MPGLGFCFPVHPSIVAVKSDSPAARAGLKPGDVISSLTLKTDEPALETGRETQDAIRYTFTFKDRTASWFSAFIRLQSRQYQEVELVVNNASTPVKIMPEARSVVALLVSRLRVPGPAPHPSGPGLHPGPQERLRPHDSDRHARLFHVPQPGPEASQPEEPGRADHDLPDGLRCRRQQDSAYWSTSWGS